MKPADIDLLWALPNLGEEKAGAAPGYSPPEDAGRGRQGRAELPGHSHVFKADPCAPGLVGAPFCQCRERAGTILGLIYRRNRSMTARG